jgi:hypothetical protein
MPLESGESGGDVRRYETAGNAKEAIENRNQFRSLRNPVRLCSEQAVDKTDVVNEKGAESHAGEA